MTAYKKDIMATKPKQPEAESRFDLAEIIRQLSEGMKQLLDSGLNKRAIVTLLKAETGLSIRNISDVLNGLDTLAQRYTSARK